LVQVAGRSGHLIRNFSSAAIQAAFANAKPASWQPHRRRIGFLDEHPHRQLPDGSVNRRTDLFQFPLLAQDWAREKLEKSPGMVTGSR
jgi:hypothetical protein